MNIFKRLLKNRISLLGLILLLCFVFVAIAAPWLAPPKEGSDPYRIPRRGWSLEPTPPSAKYPLGLTQGQYDIYYGLIWGTRTAFRVGIIVITFRALIGIILGSIAAYYGGLLDEILMRFTDIFMSFPYLIGVVVFVSIFGPGLNNVMIPLIALGWMPYARMIRGNIWRLNKKNMYWRQGRLGLVTLRSLPVIFCPIPSFPC